MTHATEHQYEILFVIDRPPATHASLYATLLPDEDIKSLVQGLTHMPFANVLTFDPNGYGVDFGVSHLLAERLFNQADMTDLLWQFTDTPENAERRYATLKQTVAQYAPLRYDLFQLAEQQGDD